MDLIKLKEEGIVIIPNVLNSDECNAMLDGMWGFFEYITSEWITQISRDDPSTWFLLELLEPSNGMMYQNWNIGHAQYLWDIRTNEKIVNIWASLFNVDMMDLLVSFDGISFLPPFELAKSNIKLPKYSNWFHLDQTVNKTEFEGLQGWVTAVDVEPGDATLLYYEKSHLMIKELTDKFGVKTNSDWYPLNDAEKDFLKSKCEIKQVVCPAGSMVIWDSRLVHCNKGPDMTRTKPNYRCISYLSYAPKNTIDPDTIDDKIYGFENLFTSNHYANKPTFFSTMPSVYKAKNYLLDELITLIEPPKLNKLGYSLVGYKKIE